MGFGGALFALSVAQAVGSIAQGNALEAEGKANASLLEGKKSMIGVQQGIEAGQYERAKGKTVSTSMANMAAMGIMPQGSSMAVLLDTVTQMNIDKAIGQFNFEQEKIYTQAEADASRRQGKAAKRAGYTNALTSVLSGAANYGMYKGWGTQNTTPRSVWSKTLQK